MNYVNGIAIAAVLSVPIFVHQPIQAKAQSFSCANAQIPSEMAICNSESLLVKDEQVAAFVSAQLVKSVSDGNLPAISREHSNWLRERNTCRNDIPCG